MSQPEFLDDGEEGQGADSGTVLLNTIIVASALFLLVAIGIGLFKLGRDYGKGPFRPQVTTGGQVKSIATDGRYVAFSAPAMSEKIKLGDRLTIYRSNEYTGTVEVEWHPLAGGSPELVTLANEQWGMSFESSLFLGRIIPELTPVSRDTGKITVQTEDYVTAVRPDNLRYGGEQ